MHLHASAIVTNSWHDCICQQTDQPWSDLCVVGRQELWSRTVHTNLPLAQVCYCHELYISAIVTNSVYLCAHKSAVGTRLLVSWTLYICKHESVIVTNCFQLCEHASTIGRCCIVTNSRYRWTRVCYCHKLYISVNTHLLLSRTRDNSASAIGRCCIVTISVNTRLLLSRTRDNTASANRRRISSRTLDIGEHASAFVTNSWQYCICQQTAHTNLPLAHVSYCHELYISLWTHICYFHELYISLGARICRWQMLYCHELYISVNTHLLLSRTLYMYSSTV